MLIELANPSKEQIKKAQHIICQQMAICFAEQLNEMEEDNEDDTDYINMPIGAKVKSIIEDMWNMIPKSDGCAYENEWIYQGASDILCDYFNLERITITKQKDGQDCLPTDL
jgi:hypothetical protein